MTFTLTPPSIEQNFERSLQSILLCDSDHPTIDQMVESYSNYGFLCRSDAKNTLSNFSQKQAGLFRDLIEFCKTNNVGVSHSLNHLVCAEVIRNHLKIDNDEKKYAYLTSICHNLLHRSKFTTISKSIVELLLASSKFNVSSPDLEIFKANWKNLPNVFLQILDEEKCHTPEERDFLLNKMFEIFVMKDCSATNWNGCNLNSAFDDLCLISLKMNQEEIVLRDKIEDDKFQKDKKDFLNVVRHELNMRSQKNKNISHLATQPLYLSANEQKIVDDLISAEVKYQEINFEYIKAVESGTLTVKLGGDHFAAALLVKKAKQLKETLLFRLSDPSETKSFIEIATELGLVEEKKVVELFKQFDDITLALAPVSLIDPTIHIAQKEKAQKALDSINGKTPKGSGPFRFTKYLQEPKDVNSKLEKLSSLTEGEYKNEIDNFHFDDGELLGNGEPSQDSLLKIFNDLAELGVIKNHEKYSLLKTCSDLGIIKNHDQSTD